MTARNPEFSTSSNQRRVLFAGAGVVCTAAVILSGCTGASENSNPFARSSQPDGLQAEQARYEQSERARKSAARKLAAALTSNKAKDRQLRAARKQIARLETRLAGAVAPKATAQNGPSGSERSEQLAATLKAKKKELVAANEAARKHRAELQAVDEDVADLETRLAKTREERDALKVQLAASEKDATLKVEKTLAPAAARQEGRIDARAGDAVSQEDGPKYSCERIQVQAAKLDRELGETRAQRDTLNQQLQEALGKVASARKEREKLDAAKTQISNAGVQSTSTGLGSVAQNKCSRR